MYEFFRPVGGQAATELTTKVMQFADRVSSGLVGSVGFALLAWTLLGGPGPRGARVDELWGQRARLLLPFVLLYLVLLLIGHWFFRPPQ